MQHRLLKPTSSLRSTKCSVETPNRSRFVVPMRQVMHELRAGLCLRSSRRSLDLTGKRDTMSATVASDQNPPDAVQSRVGEKTSTAVGR